jgi:hypothetical protein
MVFDGWLLIVRVESRFAFVLQLFIWWVLL